VAVVEWLTIAVDCVLAAVAAVLTTGLAMCAVALVSMIDLATTTGLDGIERQLGRWSTGGPCSAAIERGATGGCGFACGDTSWHGIAMRFVVIGAGAVGGVVGGHLAEHRHDVILVARGAHGEALRQRGLRIESPDAVVQLDIPVVQHPSEISWTADDVVLLTVKTQDAALALRDLRAVAPDDLPIVCMQNGVESERMALRCFARVYGVCVICPTSHFTPGVVQAWSAPTTGILDVGRYPAGVDDVARALAAALRGSTFSSAARPDIMRWKYTKLLANLGNAIEAICGPAARGGTTIGSLARAEGIACFKAAGIAYVSERKDAARRAVLNLRPIAGQARAGGSSWQSLQRRAGSIETDYLNGEVVLLGRLHGIATPANALLQRLANQMARDAVPPGTLAPEDLLALLPPGLRSNRREFWNLQRGWLRTMRSRFRNLRNQRP
jgi:2-dehydropantoate 2-reductase